MCSAGMSSCSHEPVDKKKKRKVLPLKDKYINGVLVDRKR